MRTQDVAVHVIVILGSVKKLLGRYGTPMPICSDCGQEHPLQSLELTFLRPDVVAELEGTDRESRVQENDDICILDGERFFVRALLPLPVLEKAQPYNVCLWVELSQRDFERLYQLWDALDQADTPAFDAHIANDIPIHSSVRGLAACLSLTGPTTRPVVTLRALEHPLAGEQARGITLHRAAEYSSLFAGNR